MPPKYSFETAVTIMKKRNQPKSLIEYGIELFGWGLLVVHLYRNIAFKVIPGFSLAQSNWVFWGVWLLCIATGLMFTPRRYRTSMAVFATINSPIAIYLVLSYYKLYRTAFVIALSIIGSVAIIYVCLVLATNLKDIWHGKYQGKLKCFVAGFLHKTRMIVSMGLALIFLTFYLNIFLGLPLMDPMTVSTDPKVNNQKISSNIDTILLLQEEEWAKLSTQERLDVLQTVANIEATYLGLPHELNVTVKALEETTQGHYDDSTHTIAINADHLTEDSAHDLVETVAHEAYHAYERRLVDLYYTTGSQERNLLLFGRIEEYRDNFDNYIDGDEDLIGYATQAVELDSVKYAIAAVVDYYDAIEEYLNPAE